MKEIRRRINSKGSKDASPSEPQGVQNCQRLASQIQMNKEEKFGQNAAQHPQSSLDMIDLSVLAELEEKSSSADQLKALFKRLKKPFIVSILESISGIEH